MNSQATPCRYGRLELIYKGGQATVYSAHDLERGRDVALKLLPSRFTSDPEALNRLKQEALIAFRLNHPNVVRVDDFVQDAPWSILGLEAEGEPTGPLYFTVAEFIAGKNLREYMCDKQLDVMEALDIGIQVASALSAAHLLGVVHRDVKPENIMVGADGVVKVLDFGFAKLTDWFVRRQVFNAEAMTFPMVNSDSGHTPGTPYYMSPEQYEAPADECPDIDERTDIWSLGVVLYEMLANKHPFQAVTLHAVRRQILKEKPYPLALYAPGVPFKLRRIISKALRKDRTKRYRTIDEMLGDMEELRRELEAAPARRRERFVELASVSSCFILLLLFLGFHYASLRDPDKNSLLKNLVAQATPAPTPTPESRPKRVAVVPFKAADDRDRSLGLGIANTLISELRSIPEINVYQGNEWDIGSAKVDMVVSGEVSRAGEGANERVRARVYFTKSGEPIPIWQEKFNGPAANIFGFEDAIGKQLVEVLSLSLTGKQEKIIGSSYTTNFEAYDLYNKGRLAWNRRTREGFEQAIDFFKRAAEKDEWYALPHVGLADCYMLLSFYAWRSPGDGYPKAKEAANKALRLDPNLAEAYASRAYITAFYEKNWVAAEEDFQRAIALKDKYATAHHWYALFLARVGRIPEAQAQIVRARDLDPRSTIIKRSAGLLSYYARRYDVAVSYYRDILKTDKRFVVSRVNLAQAHALKGEFAKAHAELDLAKALLPDEPSIYPTRGWIYALEGRKSGALRVIKTLKEQRKLSRQYVSPVEIAEIYAALNMQEDALDWLEIAQRENSDRLALLKADPVFDNLRSHPRFMSLVRSVGLAA